MFVMLSVKILRRTGTSGTTYSQREARIPGDDERMEDDFSGLPLDTNEKRAGKERCVWLGFNRLCLNYLNGCRKRRTGCTRSSSPGWMARLARTVIRERQLRVSRCRTETFGVHEWFRCEWKFTDLHVLPNLFKVIYSMRK